MTELSIDEKYNLIVRNLQEVVGSEDEIKKILSERPLKLYWGTAPTGRIHIGYFIQLLKIADYLKAGCEVTILFADIHAFLDNMKSNFDQLNDRTRYYETMIKEVLKSMNIELDRLRFVRGSEYQLNKDYTMDVYKLLSMTSLNDAKHAGADVVKQTENPKMNGLIYPILQVLDEEYLKCDAEASGVDQRKIFMYGRKFMPKIGYKKRLYFMTPMVSGLRFEKNDHNKLKDTVQDNKMSASNLDSKIDLLDTKNQIKKKLGRAYCMPGEIEDNTPLFILEKVIFPILGHKGEHFVINRPDKFGGKIEFFDCNSVKDAFLKEELHPGDLKLGIIDSLDSILSPIRDAFSKPDNNHILRMAYDEKYARKYNKK